MQNRYTGDIGDFGKLGLLRSLQASGLSIGVNWYLVPDETHTNDGRYVQYLEDENYCLCDEQLWLELRKIVKSGQRVVSSLERDSLLKARFFSEPLDFSGINKPGRVEIRKAWHKEALHSLSGLDIVFVDPDNGLIVPSAEGTAKENKYVREDELADYFEQGSSIIYYQHKARKPNSFYTDQHNQLIDRLGAEKSAGLGLKFIKTSQRYYFFIVHSIHRTAISTGVHKMLSSAWNNCFELLDSH